MQDGIRKTSGMGIVLFFLILLPFFDPMCLTYLRQSVDAPDFINLIYYCFIGGRIAISCIAIVACAKTISLNNDGWLIMFVISMGAVATLGSSSVFTAVQCFTYLGLMATLRFLFSKDFKAAVIALIVLFAIYAFGNLWSVYVMHGVIPGETPASTIYFFGGKNSIFMHGIPLLISLCACCVARDKQMITVAALLSFLYAYTAFVVNSLSSLACFLILGLCILLACYSKSALAIFKAPYLLAFLVLGFCLTVIVQHNDFISFISEMLGRSQGRSSTLSGRTEIWDQALSYIASSPLVGHPEGTLYLMSNGSSADHAHSFFLNIAARYGLVPLLFFLVDIIMISRRAAPLWHQPRVALMAIFYFLLLAHSLFDTMDIYIYILVRTLFLEFINMGEKSKRLHMPESKGKKIKGLL